MFISFHGGETSQCLLDDITEGRARMRCLWRLLRGKSKKREKRWIIYRHAAINVLLNRDIVLWTVSRVRFAFLSPGERQSERGRRPVQEPRYGTCLFVYLFNKSPSGLCTGKGCETFVKTGIPSVSNKE